jgi:hypothetical protein
MYVDLVVMCRCYVPSKPSSTDCLTCDSYAGFSQCWKVCLYKLFATYVFSFLRCTQLHNYRVYL